MKALLNPNNRKANYILYLLGYMFRKKCKAQITDPFCNRISDKYKQEHYAEKWTTERPRVNRLWKVSVTLNARA